MAAIDELIDKIGDSELRERIKYEVSRLQKQRKFGLVYEEHLPEATPLYDLPIKKGIMVSTRETDIKDFYRVIKVEGKNALCEKIDDTHEQITFDIKDIVAVAQFGEPIYPYLKPIDSICNAPDSSLWHTLIEADNYHALQLLTYLYEGQVDCIYIDPPYNTGAKDWKYNNDYVDGNDAYRHSKWLSMMGKRLRIAKKLLNPKDSVLIVTIDEKEYHHLACLLEQLFPEASIQMVVDIIHPSGVARENHFSRVEEYIFYVCFGCAKPCKTNDTMLDFEMTGDYHHSAGGSITWRRMIRAGSNSNRERSENCFYPIFVDVVNSNIHSVGYAPGKNVDREKTVAPEGCFALWPIHQDGSEGVWQISRQKLIEALANGTAKLGRPNRQGGWAMNYLNEGMLKEIEDGAIEVLGKDENGALILKRSSDKLLSAKSVWNKKMHDATQYGTYLINDILSKKKFTYPKSLYAVHDAIRFFVANRPNALIIDFFAGSGTTLHAVNLLNAEDGGKRRCIMVTNNEVSEGEAKELTKKGFRAGDEEWEKLGIAHYVTWPRTKCSILGEDIKGNKLSGNYIGNDIPMSDGFKTNAVFFKLSFLDKLSVSLGRNFKELIPLLWMKAGAIGKCPTNLQEEDYLILSENRFAVLVNDSAYAAFSKELSKHPEIEIVFIITNSEDGYREMISGINVSKTYQLYRDYLDNFTINNAR